MIFFNNFLFIHRTIKKTARFKFYFFLIYHFNLHINYVLQSGRKNIDKYRQNNIAI